ncbi:hypothetical protein Axi01nite_36430 [Actinoplanes xinjiangensis]|nr:hypothetical protein Axi01nite_36430 [Actinoplanes xinjiangensis]
MSIVAADAAVAVTATAPPAASTTSAARALRQGRRSIPFFGGTGVWSCIDMRFSRGLVVKGTGDRRAGGMDPAIRLRTLTIVYVILPDDFGLIKFPNWILPF